MFDRSAHQVFLDKAYNDGLELLVEVRDYIAEASTDDGKNLTPQDQAVLVHQMTKITRRLTDAMAWLLLQKAVTADEITVADAEKADAATLSCEPVVEDSDRADLSRLPLVARGLIDRSQRLYTEAERLQSSLRPASA